MYRNFLCNICNPRTGRGFWKLVEVIGYLMMIVWVVAVLPFVGSLIGISSLGYFDHGGSALIVAYKGLFSIANSDTKLYLSIIFFGIAFAKMGVLVQILGHNYRTGYVYIRPEAHSPLGSWIKI